MAGSGKSVLANVKALLSKVKVAFVSGTTSAAPNPAAPAPTATPTATTAALTNAPSAHSSTSSPSPPSSPTSTPTAAAAEHNEVVMLTQTGILPPRSGGLPLSPQTTINTIAASATASAVMSAGTTYAPRTTWASPDARLAPMHRVFVPPHPRPSSIAQQALTHTSTAVPAVEDTYVDDTAAGHAHQHQNQQQGPVVTIKQQPLQAKAKVEAAAAKGMPEQRETALMALLRDVMAGSCTGVATTVVGHPLDTVKTRLQAQMGTHRMYAGTIDCIQQTFRNEGLAGFYKGAASPLCMYLLYCSIYYSSYVQARRLFGIPDRSKPAPAHLILASTAVTGLCTTFVRTPMDLLKTKAQTVHFSETPLAGAGAATSTGNGSSGNQGTLRLGVHMVRQHGPLSLFQGFAPTLLRQVVGAFTWFFPYEFLRQRAGEGPASVFLCGGLASWVYWASVYPLDSVKTRIQSDATDPRARRFRGWVDCFRVTLRMEGTRALFNGFTACMLRAFPANAAGILAYEYARKFVDEHV